MIRLLKNLYYLCLMLLVPCEYLRVVNDALFQHGDYLEEANSTKINETVRVAIYL